MINLQTTYMGLEVSSPILVSASPLSEKIDNILKMEDAGAGAVIMFSLFEEQIKQEQTAFLEYYESQTESFAEALSYFPVIEDYHIGIDGYLNLIRVASERTNLPIIGSLNGISEDGWVNYARLMEEAGAKGIELNIFYIPVNAQLLAEDVEARYLDVLQAVKAQVSIPVAIKLNPYFSSLANFSKKLDEQGADGLVLFNRFYEPDLDIERLRIVHSLELSSASEIRLPLLWLAVLRGHVNASLAATSGVQSSTEVIKYLLAGADAVMTASALLKHGIDYLRTMNQELQSWMERRNFVEVSEIVGLMSRQRVPDPATYERANYIKILKGYEE